MFVTSSSYLNTLSNIWGPLIVKHLRVRGIKAVRFCAPLKAVGVNVFRATAVRKACQRLCLEGCHKEGHRLFLRGMGLWKRNVLAFLVS